MLFFPADEVKDEADNQHNAYHTEPNAGFKNITDRFAGTQQQTAGK